MDIYDGVEDKDREYFRRTREARFGRPLEEKLGVCALVDLAQISFLVVEEVCWPWTLETCRRKQT